VWQQVGQVLKEFPYPFLECIFSLFSDKSPQSPWSGPWKKWFIIAWV